MTPAQVEPPPRNPPSCVVCGGPSSGGECRGCYLADDVAYERRLDV